MMLHALRNRSRWCYRKGIPTRLNGTMPAVIRPKRQPRSRCTTIWKGVIRDEWNCPDERSIAKEALLETITIDNPHADHRRSAGRSLHSSQPFKQLLGQLVVVRQHGASVAADRPLHVQNHRI